MSSGLILFKPNPSPQQSQIGTKTSNSFQPNRQLADDEISSYSQHANPIPSISDFLDEPIKTAIQFILKKQKHTKSLIVRKENQILKLERHIIDGTAPPDINFKFDGYKQYPHSIPIETRQAIMTREKAMVQDLRRSLIEERIKLLGADLNTIKSTLCTTDAHWITALLSQLPVLQTDSRLQERANQLLHAALTAQQLQESIRANRTTPTPIPAHSDSNPMAVDATSDTLAALSQAVANLKLQVQSLSRSNSHTRSKNGSGSGFATTGPRRYHAAPRRSASLPSRSRSRTRQSPSRGRTPTRSKSTTRSRPRPRSRSNAPTSHEEAAPHRTAPHRHSGIQSHSRRTQRSPSRQRTPSQTFHPPGRDHARGPRRAQPRSRNRHN